MGEIHSQSSILANVYISGTLALSRHTSNGVSCCKKRLEQLPKPALDSVLSLLAYLLLVGDVFDL
jgi:hypothetical protein